MKASKYQIQNKLWKQNLNQIQNPERKQSQRCQTEGQQLLKAKASPNSLYCICTQEKEKTDTQQINAWFRAVANCINSYGIKKTDIDVLQYYGAYCSNSTADQFEIFSTEIPDERKTIPVLKKCFNTYFLPVTTLDDL
jgi:hypothetical protein